MAILAASDAVISAADISFTPRLTAPEKDDELYCRNFFAVYVADMPNCTTYAYGRAWEILGHEPDLCHGRSEQWFGNIGVSSNPNDSYERGDEPRLGAIACWDMGSYGHVSVVEAIDGDTVTVSGSDYMTPVYWQLSEYDKNDMGAGFQGYIYLLEQEELLPVEEVTAVTTSATTAPETVVTTITTTVTETTVTQPAVTSTATEKTQDIAEPQNDRSEWIVTVIVIALIVLTFIVMTVTFRILDIERKKQAETDCREK